MKLGERELMLLPASGIAGFIPLYLYGAVLYPGGAKFDSSSVGFSWVHNYWCDLFRVTAYNGMSNPARPVAVGAMIVLTIGLSFFWYFVPKLFPNRTRLMLLIRILGAISMGLAFFVSNERYHDLMINLSGLFGLIAFGTVTVALYSSSYRQLFQIALTSMVLALINFIIWETGLLLLALPMIQKATFVVFFVCVVLSMKTLRGAPLRRDFVPSKK